MNFEITITQGIREWDDTVQRNLSDPAIVFSYFDLLKQSREGIRYCCPSLSSNNQNITYYSLFKFTLHEKEPVLSDRFQAQQSD